jgi:hypothetical protein
LDQKFVEAADGVVLDAARGIALVVELGEFASDLVDVLEVAAGRAFELAAQFGVGDAAAARLKEIRLRGCASHLFSFDIRAAVRSGARRFRYHAFAIERPLHHRPSEHWWKEILRCALRMTDTERRRFPSF